MKSLTGKAIDLAKMLDYQPNSVVSSEVIRRDRGTITVFAFDKGQGLSEHTAPYDAFVYIVDGKAVIKIAGKDHNVVKGEFIILPANIPHSLKASARFKMLLVMIKS